MAADAAGTISPWMGQAFNQVPDAANQIHGNDLARQYGFSGGLVPGVTVSAYLVHPAVVAWKEEWLARGTAHVRVNSPLYDGEDFQVRIAEQTTRSYAAELVRPDATVSATATVSLPDPCSAVPRRRGDRMAKSDFMGPTATPESLARLQQTGCRAFLFRWGGDQPMNTYLRDVTQLPALLQQQGGGRANHSFVLSCADWILERNAAMNPWVHLETRSRNFAPISAGTDVVAEMRVSDLFEKKGHKFVDVEVALFREPDDVCLCLIELRAIYQLRDTT